MTETNESQLNQNLLLPQPEQKPLYLKSNISNDTHLYNMMILRQEVLNKRIGTQAWKKYLSAAFWNYITTPINFCITLLTAIATGQAATGDSSSYKILSPQQTLIILFVTFILTTTNSFFKLNTKMTLNFEAARCYYEFGTQFEIIYYTPIYTDACIEAKLVQYNILHQKINKYMLSETIENQNYLTELVYKIAMKTSFGNFSKWINKAERHSELDGINDKETNMSEIFKNYLPFGNSSNIVKDLQYETMCKNTMNEMDNIKKIILEKMEKQNNPEDDDMKKSYYEKKHNSKEEIKNEINNIKTMLSTIHTDYMNNYFKSKKLEESSQMYGFNQNEWNLVCKSMFEKMDSENMDNVVVVVDNTKENDETNTEEINEDTTEENDSHPEIIILPDNNVTMEYSAINGLDVD